MIPERALSRIFSDPGATIRALDKIDAEGSLLSFVRTMWPILEPQRKFIEGWCLETICEHLEAISRGQIRRLLINVPPGTAKSLLTSVFWPAWEWGPQNRPDMRYVCASYSDGLTIRDNMKCRRLIQSLPFQEMWGDRFQISEDANAKVRFDTDKTGFKLATSVGGVGTGERGDRFIIDDPHSVKQAESEAIRESTIQWFTEVVPTRINDPDKSAILVIMQRVHERDISGLILTEELGYDLLCLPMEYEEDHPFKSRTAINFVDPRSIPGELLWPERFTKRHLDEDLKPSLRAWGGMYAESGQLQQRPSPRGGGMFKRANLQFIDSVPPASRRVRGWDLAATHGGGAWTVGAKIAMTPDRKVILEDIVRIQGSPGEVEKLIVATATQDTPSVIQDLPQDPGQAGKAQARHLLTQHLQGFRAYFTPETGSKEDRAFPLAAQSEAGNFYLLRAPWNEAFIREAEKFPAGQFKDQVDAASRAYSRLVRKGPTTGVAAPQILIS